MLEDKLERLGLTQHDISVYLCVLRHKRILPSLIARDTGINRSTVYSVVKSLAKRGLVFEDLGGKSKYVLARSPNNLENLTRPDKRNLESKERLIRDSIEELSTLVGTESLPIPRIRYVEEDDLADFFERRLATYHESTLQYDGTWWGFQDSTFVERYEKSIDHGWRVAPKGIKVRLVSNESSSEKRMHAKKYAVDREIKNDSKCKRVYCVRANCRRLYSNDFYTHETILSC